jgi:hypothetical protein
MQVKQRQEAGTVEEAGHDHLGASGVCGGAVGLGALCPHGHLISRFQIDVLADSLAGAVGDSSSPVGRGVSLVNHGNRNSSAQEL